MVEQSGGEVPVEAIVASSCRVVDLRCVTAVVEQTLPTWEEFV